jgi:hypothetical protein
MTPNITPTDLHIGNDLLDAIRAKAAGDELSAARLAIPRLKADPVLAGSFVLSMLHHAIRDLAAHCHETPSQTVERLWSKPETTR